MQVPFGLVPPGIVTTGDATVRVKPDAAIVMVGAVVQGATARETQAKLNDRVAALLKRARALGIPENDIKTVGFRIDPQYAHEQPNAPRLAGYQGTQQIALVLTGTDGVGDALDQLVRDDSANTAAVTFTLRDRKEAEATARDQAIQDARAKAQAMARSAGVTLGKVTSVNELAAPVGWTAFAPMAARAELPAGETELVVRVQVQFEIS